VAVLGSRKGSRKVAKVGHPCSDPKSTKGMLVGYSRNKKAWRVLVEPVYGEPYIVESRDCLFNEGETGALPLCKDQAAEDFASLFLDGIEGSPSDDRDLGEAGPSTSTAAPSNPSNEANEPGSAGVSDARAENSAQAVEIDAQQETAIPDSQDTGHAAEEPSVNNEERECSSSQNTEGFVARYPMRTRRAATTPYDAYVKIMKALTDEPASYEEVKDRLDYPKWKSAMEDEYRSLVEQKTFEWVTLPGDCHAVPSRWVFVIKRDATGNVEKYKARVVAKGFRQVQGRDYGEVYAPVSKHATMRAMLAYAAVMDLELIQLDVKTAFLNGELEEEIYMKPPPGYEKTGKVWRLHKALYGLKQAARAWHHKLRAALKDIGFEATAADPSLFVSKNRGSNGPGAVFVLTYVDDMLIAGTRHDANSVKKALMSTFKCHDLGSAKVFLGMSIVRDRTARTLWLGQTKFSKGILDRFNFAEARPRRTPMDANLKLSMHGEDAEKKDIDQYPELIGCLLYLSGCTRPDIAQAVGTLSRFTAAPKEDHVKAAKQLLKYIAGTTGLGIIFGKKNKSLVGYSDADYAGDVDKRRSTSGYVFVLHGGAISWRSKLQATVAASTCEAEFVAASTAAKEALWLRQLIAEFTGQVKPVTMHVDNQGALALLHHPHGHQRTKHIDVAYKFVQDRVERGEIACVYCATNDMLADCLTKALPVQKFVENRNGMGMQEAGPDNEDM
jgi:Reverse transcriptase (RNA-dependent DNA polymerase)